MIKNKDNTDIYMKRLPQFTLLVFLLVSSAVSAQQQRTFKFDFGGKKARAGYTPVMANTTYTDALGYGFINNAEAKDVTRARKKKISSDFITGNKPFFFSVKLPEGNYDVKVTLGDVAGTSATTVRAENRRLFLHNVQTKKGEIKTHTFTVHVKDSLSGMKTISRLIK